MKKWYLIYCILFATFVTGCHEKNEKKNVLYDGVTAQITLNTEIMNDNLTKKDDFLDVWCAISDAERNSIRETIDNGFSDGVQSLTMYFPKNQYIVLYPDQGKQGLCIASDSEGRELWTLTIEELMDDSQ